GTNERWRLTSKTCCRPPGTIGGFTVCRSCAPNIAHPELGRCRPALRSLDLARGSFPQGISGYSSFGKGFAMPRTKLLVGLNADFRPSRKEGPALSFIPAGYYSAIQAAGGIPVILPPTENEADLGRLLEMLDAFVLVGGG